MEIPREQLNKKQKNILIIECSERTADWRLTDTVLAYPKLYIKKLILQRYVLKN